MKTIFVVQGYDDKNEVGQLSNVVTFEIYSKTEKDAIIKAKSYIKKNNYRVSNVIEKLEENK